MIIYAVAQESRDRDNYRQVGSPISVWYIDRSKAQTLCDEKNEPLLEKLQKENDQEVIKVARENAEYAALVVAGLREPREPKKPYQWAQLRYSEPYVVIEDELAADLEQLVEMLQAEE